ncbi:multidrug efflux SMR transporter [Hymenobacter sp. BT175]|uniref:DMT family transporter n=1 Tax=Hymenobacter translucens TaxID=2886507 RepID=UPI001D0E3D0D|nr:multidrug efflux SMR transporter [Hymenobacter translucens]MCC2545418.1 multidrug efflux SMR transporter [Hymenobacter translucens]
MNWVYLIIGGFCEIGFAACMGKAREANGGTALLWWVGFAAFLTLSMYLLYRATLTLPIGTAYAVWTGIGAVGSVVVGILIFKEPATFWRLFFLFTLICSILGLKAVTNA